MRSGGRRRLVVLSVLMLIAAVSLEILLRSVWGLGEMVLFQEDSGFEYLPKPNQNLTRFGHRIFYNEFSMRSLPLTKGDSCVVLGFGDSVLNGGTLTDQDSLATSLVENQVQTATKNGFRFLNISAGSWGPDNCAAYLEKYGSFNAKMIVLFVSSHDAHDNMTFEKTVGVHESYPSKQYPLAIVEVLARYIMPRVLNIINAGEKTDDLMINKNGVGFNAGFDFFKNFAVGHGIPLLVCLHAERAEVEVGEFNAQGHEILEYCSRNNIKVISGLEIGEKLSDFRDVIHINEQGQKRWAAALSEEIKKTIRECL